MNRRQSWSGGNGTGSTNYTATEVERVKRALEGHRGRTNATSTALLANETRLEGRTLRAILSAIDGADGLCLAMPSDGRLYVCEYADEADRTTKQLRSRARKLINRADRRDVVSFTLPVRQYGLPFDDEEYDDDDE